MQKQALIRRPFALYRVGNFDEFVRNAKAGREMITKRLYPVPLGRMMTRGDIGNTGFPRKMHGRLGNFARNIRVGADAHCLLQKILGGAGTPCHAPHELRQFTNDLRWPIKSLGNARDQVANRQRFAIDSVRGQIMLAKRACKRQFQHTRQLGVIADFGVRIERQMKCEQIELVLEPVNPKPKSAKKTAAAAAAAAAPVAKPVAAVVDDEAAVEIDVLENESNAAELVETVEAVETVDTEETADVLAEEAAPDADAAPEAAADAAPKGDDK